MRPRSSDAGTRQGWVNAGVAVAIAGRLSTVGAFQARRIDEVHRVVADIGVEIHPVVIADRVGLEEAAEPRGIEAGLVMIEAELAQPGLAGILEAARIGRGGDSIFVVAVDRRRVAGGIANRDDAAALVGVEEAAVGGAGALVPRQDA